MYLNYPHKVLGRKVLGPAYSTVLSSEYCSRNPDYPMRPEL